VVQSFNVQNNIGISNKRQIVSLYIILRYFHRLGRVKFLIIYNDQSKCQFNLQNVLIKRRCTMSTKLFS